MGQARCDCVQTEEMRLQHRDLRTVMSDSLLRMVGRVPTRLRLRGACSLPGSSSSEDMSVDSGSAPGVVLHQHCQRQPLSRHGVGKRRAPVHSMLVVH